MTTHRSRIRPVHLLAAAALVAAMGGSATASALVTGRDIKNGTVTTRDVKDRSLRAADFAPGVLPAATPTNPATPGTPAEPEVVPAARAEGVAGSCDATGANYIYDVPAGVRLHWTRTVIDNAGIVADTCVDSSDLVAPRTGVYLVTASLEWPSLYDSQPRTLGIRVAGSPYLAADRRSNVPGEPTQQSVSTLVRLTQGEAVQVWAYQSTGSIIAIDGTLSTSSVTMSWVSA